MRSSIFRIMPKTNRGESEGQYTQTNGTKTAYDSPTHSVARVISDVLTSRGCTTCSAHIPEMVPFFTLIPADTSPALCLLRSSVTSAIGLMPAFSARV
jgi:hypothetical protein